MVRSEMKPPASSIICRTLSIVSVDVLAIADRAACTFLGPTTGVLNHLNIVALLTDSRPGMAWMALSEFSIRWCKLSPAALATKFFTFSLLYILTRMNGLE